MNKTCGNCRLWKATEHNKGICRYHPPGKRQRVETDLEETCGRWSGHEVESGSQVSVAVLERYLNYERLRIDALRDVVGSLREQVATLEKIWRTDGLEIEFVTVDDARLFMAEKKLKSIEAVVKDAEGWGMRIDPEYIREILGGKAEDTRYEDENGREEEAAEQGEGRAREGSGGEPAEPGAVARGARGDGAAQVVGRQGEEEQPEGAQAKEGPEALDEEGGEGGSRDDGYRDPSEVHPDDDDAAKPEIAYWVRLLKGCRFVSTPHGPVEIGRDDLSDLIRFLEAAPPKVGFVNFLCPHCGGEIILDGHKTGSIHAP